MFPSHDTEKNSWSEKLKKDKTGLHTVKTYEKNIDCLKKLIKILPRYEKNMNDKISHAEYACALGYLDGKNYLCFKIHMNNSKTILWYDYFHKLFYIFREFRFFVYSIFYMKKTLKFIFKRN